MSRFTQSILIILIAVCGLVVGCGSGYTTIETYRQSPENSEKAAIGSDNDATTHLREGLILFRQAHYQKAREYFLRTIENGQNDWLACYYLGLVEIKLGDYGRAVGHLRRSLQWAPTAPRSRSRIYLAMGESWELNGDPGRARLHYGTALDLHPESVDAKQGLARLARISQSDQ